MTLVIAVALMTCGYPLQEMEHIVNLYKRFMLELCIRSKSFREEVVANASMLPRTQGIDTSSSTGIGSMTKPDGSPRMSECRDSNSIFIG